MKKRGQMKLSFGMIFSIILVVLFLSFGFYGIKTLLDTQDKVQVEKFVDGLQKKVNDMQGSNYGSDEVSFLLPSHIEGICFVNEKNNLQLHEEDFFEERVIDNLNEEKTVGDKESLCIKVVGGKVEFLLSKEYGEGSVTVSKKE